jgi:hypothetical protein
MFLSMLLGLYEETKQSGDKSAINGCLDAWDLLFENRVGAIRELARSLER